jgi:hypothetical protein
MDIRKMRPAKADEGAVLQLVHPDTQEVIEGVTITLLGQDSKVYRKIHLAKQQAALNRMSKGKRATDLKAEQLQESVIDDLVKLTVAWTGFEDGDEFLECTQENARAIYSDEGLNWIKEQAEEFVADRANFFC